MKLVFSQKGVVVLACLLVAGIFFLVPMAKPDKQKPDNQGAASAEAPLLPGYSTDTVLAIFRSRLTPALAAQLSQLEKAVPADTTEKINRMRALHELAHFWKDEASSFSPYIWYESEASRLENSEKSLTFAAHLLLDSLQQEEDENLRRWKALLAKDLFERSLILNPNNDSARVGLGACYLFGGISAAPMVGIRQIKTVVDRDSAFDFGQMTLVKASLLSNQLPKAEERLRTVVRLRPDNLDALLLLAELREQSGDKIEALTLYKKCLALTDRPDWKKALEERIRSLSN
ncbi:MAG: tetratricopeptide repeat protein [Bacteroidota bacterium]